MEMDVPLKVLFRQYAGDLLRLTHDEESTVLSVDAVELQSVSRRVDCLIKLRRKREVYYRHIEFQSGPDPDMAERCFRYNSQLLLQLKAPVLTVVVYLVPPGPTERSLTYRVVVGAREYNVWHFDEVRLWGVSAAEALDGGAPGLLALVPLMEGGQGLDVIARAAAAIAGAQPGERNPDARSILLYLAGALYNVDVLTRLFGREEMIQSSVWQAAWAEGIEADRRDLCLELVSRHHPKLLPKAKDAIGSCTDPDVLRNWILSAGQLDDPAFARLLGIE